ncbi:hypothetical protein QEZ54_16445 [Catellatospora sp. KI3]|uniref:hypothetical protein n=1 Tax=Catellatospora sp. KI3 TaxID=3041620 RepID=UPI00248281FD|nr:hypothetical protein [Catellatospora sp. KI3]MDI1462563.1 hypothetical protein [Catellatospora sp. KI3]
MDAAMLLTTVMIFGGPVIWWILRRTARYPSPAAANVSSLAMKLSLLLYVVAGLTLFLSGVYSVGNTVGSAIWLLAGLLALWATTRWRLGLPAIIDRWSAAREASLRADASAGNNQAAYLLGMGLKLRGEREEARRWLQQAAEAGLVGAQWDLARLVDEMDGAAAAKPWFQAAADAGHPGARHLLRPGGAYDTAN